VKSCSLTIRFSSIFLAAFLAIQVSTLWASTNNVKDIDIVVKKKPGGALVQAKTDSNGNFSIQVDGAGTYQVTAAGGKVLTPGTSVKLTFSVQPAKPASADSRQVAPVSRAATAVLDALGGLDFPGDIQVSEASVLTGHLEVVETPAPAKEQNPAKTPIKK
jgi:hypothetical protein